MRVLVWRDSGELVGVCPFSLIADRPAVRPIRQLALWGTIGPRLRGLVDVLARDDRRTAILDSLCGWLNESSEWDLMHVNRPQVDSPTPGRLRRAATQLGWSYVTYDTPRSTTYQVDLPDSVESWDTHLDAKDRRSVRARQRRFEAFRGGSVTPAVGVADVPEALSAMERILGERWGDKEVYFRAEPSFRPFIHEAIPQMIANGSAWLSVARDESGVVAGLVSAVQNGNAMSVLMAATPEQAYRQFSLGDIIHNAGIGEAVARGSHTYDLLWMGGYKESYWHAQPRHLESAFIGRGVFGKVTARVLARRS